MGGTAIVVGATGLVGRALTEWFVLDEIFAM
jgi:hypothetical protein